LKQEESEIPTLFDLKDNNLLDKIADAIPNIVGEINNKKIIFLSCISKDLQRKFRNGLSIVVSSKSSAGKSTLIENCLKPFQESVFEITKFTESFFQRHFKDKSLDNMIIHQEQMEKTNSIGQACFDIPKFQLSEGITRIGLSERDKHGKFQDTVFEITGMPIIIASTTNPDIEPQQLNRITLLQTDESEQQTKKILTAILKGYSTNRDNYSNDNLDELTKLGELYKKECKLINDIVIPFENQLIEKFPKTLEMRRDLTKILNYTCIIAFLHFKIRKKIRIIEHGFADMYANTEPVYRAIIIADLSDFKECLEIGIDIFSQTLNKVNNSAKVIIELVRELESGTEHGVNSATITNLKDIKQNQVNDLLRQGHTAGFLSKTKIGRENFYRTTKKELDVIDISSINFTDKDFQKWYNENFSDKKYELVYPELKE